MQAPAISTAQFQPASLVTRGFPDCSGPPTKRFETVRFRPLPWRCASGPPNDNDGLPRPMFSTMRVLLWTGDFQTAAIRRALAICLRTPAIAVLQTHVPDVFRGFFQQF